jgi:uncharacterized membrane protein
MRSAGGTGAVIKLEFIYVLMGLLTGGVALVNAFDGTNPRRVNNTLFWGIYAITFLAGSYISDFASGCLVILMVVSASVRGLGQGANGTANSKLQAANSLRRKNLIFLPALLIPAVTLAGSLTLKNAQIFGRALVDPKQVTQVSLGLATLVALAVGMIMLRPPLLAPLREARRLLDSVGWAAVLPQTLAALGAVFALAGVGTVVSGIAQRWIPLDYAFVAVATYTVGMAVFTMVMGNAFAAFPVMTAGIGLPVIVQHFGGNVVIMAAVGMVSGFCGTLMTPMAANFNLVPVALLELPDQHAVIKVQIPTAIPLLIANTLLMYFCVFRY